MTSAPKVRFAPSPTGQLHIGNIRTALFNWLFAKNGGGQFVLRLDDTDQERSTDAFARQIVEDLAWLGIAPDETHKQSDRFEHYADAAQALKDKGLLYPCYESPDEIERRRKRLMARGKPPVYDRAALRLTEEERAELEAQGKVPHWRFLLPNFETDPFSPRRSEIHFDDIFLGEQRVDLASMSDPILIRGDGTYLYTLPSVVDDMEMGITHVIRGGDHITNTGAQIAIFQALGAHTVPTFGHHNLLTGGEGEGLSKRTGALSIASLKKQRLEPMAVNSLAVLIGTGQSVEACSSMADLGALFDPSKVSRSPARFSPDELAALNEKLLHAMAYGEAQPRLADRGWDGGEEFWNAVRPNLAIFEQAGLWHGIILGEDAQPSCEPDDRDYLTLALETLPTEPWDGDVWKTWTQELKSASGRKGRGLFMPLRLALTGKDYGPDMSAVLPLIGPEKTRRRLHELVG